MSYRSELNAYVTRLQQRLRLAQWLRGAAIFAGTALLLTFALVLLLNRLAFPMHGVAAARAGLFAALIGVAIFAVAVPLIRLNRARAVRRAESANPDLEQRLTTWFEREAKGNDPFLELLAADTLTHTRDSAPQSLVPSDKLFALGGAAAASFGVLVWMIAAGPGFVGYGASLLWTGTTKHRAPLYAIAVLPGDATVRRNSDQLISARVTGMRPGKVQLYARYRSASGWEPVAMQPQPDSGGAAQYQLVLAGIPENVEYYVAAGPLVSPHYRMRVVDLPSVKGIRIVYHYPQWTGLKPTTEEHSGDLRAIEGTDAQVELQMDRPLQDGQLLLDSGQAIHLTSEAGNRYSASIHMEKDGSYHIAAIDEGQQVRLSEDYFIATDKANPPQIAIERPAGDYRASPIEEVTVGVEAADTFGLRDMHLHYSVNGGPDRDVSLLKTPNAKSADGKYTLPLEDFKVVPGDVVSLYASARNGHLEAHTDISFVQVDPFEREFSQSQQEGGGGGGGGGGAASQTEMSKREKELISQTWKQQNDKTATPKDGVAAGQFLAEAQDKLRDQVLALQVRMQARDLSEANEEFNGFEKDMQDAAAAMAPSTDKLKGMQWKDALPFEQKALQALLRAEATFRQIQVAFGQQGGGGGGGGNAGRDLASLFDLELDTAKNQYETARTGSPQEQHQKDVEDALEKLDALAKRQQELAQQPAQQQSFQQRWQQEMLRREAEQLQRQMDQMARSNQKNGNQSSAEQASSGSTSSAQGTNPSGSDARSSSSRRQSNGSSGSSDSDQRIQQALSRLHEADEAMKRSEQSQQSADAARQAADRLREATSLMAGSQQQLASGQLGSLAQEADRLAQQEREQSDRINQLANQQNDFTHMNEQSMMAALHQRDQLAGERQKLSDDLSNLTTNVRNSAREMASTQPETAKKLRDALSQADDTDLNNHVQRSADWLRRGINPNSNGTESQIAQGLQRLDEQLQQAQKEMGQAKPSDPTAGKGDETAALDRIERLRNQIEAMTAAGQGNNGRSSSGALARNGERGGQPGQQPSGQGSPGTQAGNSGSRQGDDSRNTAALSRNGTSDATGRPGGIRNGDVGGRVSGDIRTGGGNPADDTAWNNINTGNNRYAQAGQRPVPTDAAGNPPDTERTFEQGMRELNQLRSIVQSDPQAAKELEALTREMRRLDPSRFPGNPEIIEQMHKEVLTAVDRLELEVQRSQDSTYARTGKPDNIPAGYQESVAEYYRQLSRSKSSPPN